MPLFEDTDADEIRRLRQLVAKLEEVKTMRTVMVEMEPRPGGDGYLFYITAPTMACEAEFGLALSQAILQTFKVMGASMRQDVAGGVHIAPEREEEPSSRCFLTKGALGRWIIVNVESPGLAWSGSKWVKHKKGVPTDGTQISNFANKIEAFRDASGAGLTVAVGGCHVVGGECITCFKCGMTSYNKNDVLEKYCGYCDEFHEKTERVH